MKIDIQKQLASSVERQAESAPDRFQALNCPPITAAPGASRQLQPQSRDGKSDGRKFWLKDADTRLISELKSRAQRMGYDSNRSQIVRAGVHLLKTLSEDEFRALIEAECAADEASGVRR